MKRKILIIAGEASGDHHGAALINRMKEIDPGISFIGVGGDIMESAGAEIIYHIKDMAFLGFSEVVKHLPFIFKVRADLLNSADENSIREAILIDYPGFNLNIAKKLKAKGLKIIYYISPQVWAWGERRVSRMKKLIDKMIVIFPFEEEYFRRRGIDAVYAGHPIVNRIRGYNFTDKSEFFKKYNLNDRKEILLVLPGSRKQEIKRIFPETIKAASEIAEKFNMQTVVACAQNIDESLFEPFGEKYSFIIIKGFTFELFKYSKFGIIKSGTSTLEAGYFQLPFIVVYNTSRITYLLGKYLIRIKNIAMANIIAGKNIVPELIQNRVSAGVILNTAAEILSDEKKYNKIKDSLGIVKLKLGEYNSEHDAARIIYDYLNAA